jgi:prepilin-type N-terminal cleavage/methylation domain-containing protein
MNVQQKQNQKGFTIIEVVLVLAIAGLIFLMVFIALPALQRNQRDTQRKNDLSRAVTAVQNYQSNNRNSLPDPDDAGWATLAEDYLRTDNDVFADPAEGDYVFSYKTDLETPTALSSTIFVHGNAACDGEKVVSAGDNKVAFSMKLEGGGVACASN